jgi:hypothetical protein
MDEKTAGTRWCPFSRLGDEDGSTFNRLWNGGIQEATTCFGSQCMAWRRRYPNSTEGYCGLVGSPWVTP